MRPIKSWRSAACSLQIARASMSRALTAIVYARPSGRAAQGMQPVLEHVVRSLRQDRQRASQARQSQPPRHCEHELPRRVVGSTCQPRSLVRRGSGFGHRGSCSFRCGSRKLAERMLHSLARHHAHSRACAEIAALPVEPISSLSTDKFAQIIEIMGEIFTCSQFRVLCARCRIWPALN